jgi:hypothetical protein
MKTTKNTRRGKAQTRGISEPSGRRQVLAALAAAAVVPVSSCCGPGSPEEALAETYEALKRGAGAWNPADAKDDYLRALHDDFHDNFKAYWKEHGEKVKGAAVASGILAALIAEACGAMGNKLTTQHVFMGSAIVKDRACPPKDTVLPLGIFCARANFGSPTEAIKALSKLWPPKA